MLDYKKEYERWLASDALSADEKAELKSIAGDEIEIESRFYGPLEFGTAGLRGALFHFGHGILTQFAFEPGFCVQCAGLPGYGAADGAHSPRAGAKGPRPPEKLAKKIPH